MLQGLGCSPIKAVRELGSERRETVRSISGGVGVGLKALRRPNDFIFSFYKKYLKMVLFTYKFTQ